MYMYCMCTSILLTLVDIISFSTPLDILVCMNRKPMYTLSSVHLFLEIFQRNLSVHLMSEVSLFCVHVYMF